MVFFMKKMILFVCLFVFLGGLGFVLDCAVEKAQLRENIVRLHVVANSDSSEDQSQKLRVRDALIAYLQPMLEGVTSAQEATDMFSQRLQQIQQIAADLLAQEDSSYCVNVKLQEETFAVRHYDTFSLPAGVYTSLRVEIGEAAGKNWWCVAFPSLCMPAAGKSFTDEAVSAGFSQQLADSLQSDGKVKIRFYFMDMLGNLENFFYNG